MIRDETPVKAASVTASWSAPRRVGFYTIVLVLLIGINGVFWRINLFAVLAWLPDDFLNDFYSSQLDFDHITSGTFAPHTVHYLAIVATHWSVMIGLMLQLRNPIDKVAPMWQATGGLLIVTPTWLVVDASQIPPPVVAILALAVIGGALHPASIFRTLPRVGSKPMAALWAAAVVPLLLLLTSELRLQGTGVAGDPHWQGLHYNFMAEYGLVLILVLGLGATSLPGWRYSVWTGAFLLVLLGTGFVTHPNYPSSRGVFWGVVMIGFAAVWTLLGERRHRRMREAVNAWWGLLAILALFAVSGLIDLATGVTWQAVDVTGSTSAEIAAQSSAGSELSDFLVRTHGLGLIALGMVLCAVLLVAYRHDRPWAWWAMWTLPVFAISNSLLMLSFGAWGPAITGSVVGLVAAVILLVGAPRFFGRSAPL